MVTRSSGRVAAVTTVCVVALLVAGVGAVATQTATTGTDRPIRATAPAQEAAQETTATMQNESGTPISIRDLSAPDRVSLGTNYTVSATVVNRADEQVSDRTRYQIAGNVIATQRVEVPANGTEIVRFDVTGNDTAGFPTGTFTHGVYAEGAAATANVTLVDETTPTETTTPADAPTTTAEETPATAETTEDAETTPVTEETTTTELTETPTATETTATEPTETATTTEPNETTTTTEATANLVFENQTSNGSSVTVGSVTVPEGGFVVVHDNSIVEGNVVDSILGESSYLEAGTHRNVTIELNESLDQSQRLVAVAYRDSNDNRTFDLVTSNRTADGPYTKPDSREAVNGIAVVDVDEGTTNATTES